MSHPEPNGSSTGSNFAYLDEPTKRSIRRAVLKAVAIPGHQIPVRFREIPIPYGWGSGGSQVTASVIGQTDVLKVIDQGADAAPNAVRIRRFFKATCGIQTTSRTQDATLIQTRHRIPEIPLRTGQILVYQVSIPDPLGWVEPSRAKTSKMHALEDYGPINVKLYEDIIHYGRITRAYDYPVMVHDRYLMSPSGIPRFDNPKMHMNPALQLFGAGREQRVYAVPPYTRVKSLDFEDYPFMVERGEIACKICGSTNSFLHDVGMDGSGRRQWSCSDTDYCQQFKL